MEVTFWPFYSLLDSAHYLLNGWLYGPQCWSEDGLQKKGRISMTTSKCNSDKAPIVSYFIGSYFLNLRVIKFLVNDEGPNLKLYDCSESSRSFHTS
jgi:hypothetical protein